MCTLRALLSRDIPTHKFETALLHFAAVINHITCIITKLIRDMSRSQICYHTAQHRCLYFRVCRILLVVSFPHGVAFLQGVSPRIELLQKYNLPQYVDVVRGIRYAPRAVTCSAVPILFLKRGSCGSASESSTVHTGCCSVPIAKGCRALDIGSVWSGVSSGGRSAP
jgi:hypothetical protein